MFNKRFLLTAFSIGSFVFLLSSCIKEKDVNDEIITQPQSIAKFATNITGSSYTISNPAAPLKIPVGYSTVSDKDRTIQLSYTSPSGAAQGVQYNAPASINIPAGKLIDTLQVQGLYDGFPNTTKRDTVFIKIVSSDSAAYNNQYRVIMRKG